MSSQIRPHVYFPEPPLAFHPERKGDRDTHPLRGLLKFGPYSSNLVPDPIRVATIAPAGQKQRLYGFMRELNSEYQPNERREYLPKWPGFANAFRLSMRGAATGCHIELDAQLEQDWKTRQRRISSSPNGCCALCKP
jgi:hypothetical protein